MDLSFARHLSTTHGAHAIVLPVELAVLLVGVATRQAASPTARVQGALSGAGAAVRALLAPGAGAFHAETATALKGWKGA